MPLSTLPARLPANQMLPHTLPAHPPAERMLPHISLARRLDDAMPPHTLQAHAPAKKAASACTWTVRGVYVDCTWSVRYGPGATWRVRGLYVACTWTVRGVYVDCTWSVRYAPGATEVLDVYVPAHTLARVLSSQQQEQQQQQQQQQQGGSQNLSYDTPTPASMQGCYPAAPVVLFTHGGVWASVLVGISWPWPCFTGLRWPEGPLQTLPPPVILRKPPQGQRVHPASNPTSPPLPHLHHHCRRRIYHANPQMVFLKHHQNQFAAGIEQARSSPSAAFAPGEKGHPGWRGHIFTPHIYMAQGVSRWKFAGGTATES
ncbi:hypothetical protein DUNSADRAFT_14930 [Dunaliella salina]|uniref:Uncharacterized protein n=1 Tax=Dunaliella salina TaxID=3046 RepID=A0ABQ7G6D4_DUNSA|nr:hypothetical protein DUNSADRAFT_14930 [Dunaliella salina]|eukprot:KAF5830174.1 hypothetical protein DUNSADRAFT_14930 [Dunaliella salina]